VSIARIAVLMAAGWYAYRAGQTYWWLRSHQTPQEREEFRAHILCTPALWRVAPAILRAEPVIAEFTCMLNGLLWGVELLTRPWRARPRQEG
jgi:hypothetical protein